MPNELSLKTCDHIGIKNGDCESCCLDYPEKCVPVEKGEVLTPEQEAELREEDCYDGYINASLFWSTVSGLKSIFYRATGSYLTRKKLASLQRVLTRMEEFV